MLQPYIESAIILSDENSCLVTIVTPHTHARAGSYVRGWCPYICL